MKHRQTILWWLVVLVGWTPIVLPTLAENYGDDDDLGDRSAPPDTNATIHNTTKSTAQPSLSDPLTARNTSNTSNGHTTAAAPSNTAGVCAKANLDSLPATKLGSSPITIKSFLQGDQICFQFSLDIANAGWFAVGFARESAMVNSPPASCLVFQRGQQTPISYLIQGYDKSSVTPESDQSSIATYGTSSQRNTLSFTIQRSLAASNTNQVTIDPSIGSTLIWAYGTSWPISGHKSGTYGIESYNCLTAQSFSLGTGGFCDSTNCAAVFGGGAFLLMLLGGIVVVAATRKKTLSHWLVHRTLVPPPTKRISNARILWNPITALLQTLCDLSFGQLAVLGIFVAAFVALLVASPNESSAALVGRLAVLCLMLLFVPVSRVPWLWELGFGSSFERIVKFHRWLGMVFVVVLLVHVVMALGQVDLLDMEEFNDVVPVYGTVAAISFVAMALAAVGPIRRAAFEVFYYTHRLGLVVGVVFTLLHADYTRTVMIFPVVLYLLSLLWRWFTCVKYFGMHATIGSHSEGTTSVTLQPNGKTRALVDGMNVCSYFWVHCADVSMVQWHPFSAIVTPSRDSIGFVVKSMGQGTFSHRLAQLVRSQSQTKVTLCGPFGRIGLHLNDYEVILLVAGGVGITPLVSLVNHQVFSKNDQDPTLKKKLLIVWSVRDASDLLMIDDFVASPSASAGVGSSSDMMHPSDVQFQTGASVQWMRHVSNAASASINGVEELSIKRRSGEELRYVAGKPILDEVINTTRFANKRVAVLACGPPTLVLEAQQLARNCSFDFHKEVFCW